jgi:hypothetical protein
VELSCCHGRQRTSLSLQQPLLPCDLSDRHAHACTATSHLQGQIMAPDRAAKDADLRAAKPAKGADQALQFFGDNSKAWCVPPVPLWLPCWLFAELAELAVQTGSLEAHAGGL